jgi:A/G-specific adenine glycosylase
MQTVAEQGLEDERIVSLLAWYDAHARDLPWRVRGRRADPYRVWLSEIMLQQTTVAAVRDYFLKFVAIWPTVETLAAAPLDDVLKAWAGLGYYARARNLHACARDVVENHRGKFPASFDGLLTLPGVGPYTAGAIAAIAFDMPCAAVDGNVERVLSRYHAIEEPLPGSKPRIRAFAESLIPSLRAGDMVQALMDLGATVCTPKSPSCGICPWTEDCAGRKLGIAAALPRKIAKKAVPTRKGYAYWVTREDGAVLLRRREEKGLLGGMMEVPGSEWKAVLPKSVDAEAPLKVKWQKLPGIVEHTFTHFHLEVKVMVAQVGEVGAPENCRWVLRNDVDGEALPSVMRKVVAHARGGPQRDLIRRFAPPSPRRRDND